VSTVMKCGCAAHGVVQGPGPKREVCAIHMCTEPAPVQPVLTGRFAMCTYGDHAKVASNAALAFFEHRASSKHDRYYCGCFGWD